MGHLHRAGSTCELVRRTFGAFAEGGTPQNPFDYLNAAVEGDKKRAREDDEERRPKKAGRDRRPKKAGQSRGRVEELPNRDRVTCHRCGVFGHRAKQCTARVVDSANFFGEE